MGCITNPPDTPLVLLFFTLIRESKGAIDSVRATDTLEVCCASHTRSTLVCCVERFRFR